MAIPNATATPRQRWEKMVELRCDCAAGTRAVFHIAGCPLAGAHPPMPPEHLATDAQKLYTSAGVKPPVHKRKQRVPPPIPSYRFILQFNFTRPVNVALWKKIKAPKGWKKNPTTAAKQDTYRGVRFRCDDFKYALAPADIELLHMKLLLSLKAN